MDEGGRPTARATTARHSALVLGLAMLCAGDGALRAQEVSNAVKARPVQSVGFDPLINEPRHGLFIRVLQARDDFDVDGTGLNAAVIDSGIRASHVDFLGRVPAGINLSGEGSESDVQDGNGHGTFVAGILAANGVHRGIAPGAGLIPIRVLSHRGATSLERLDAGLKWVLANREKLHIGVVNVSFSDGRNYRSDSDLLDHPLRITIRALRDANVPVVAAAGSEFADAMGQQGMGIPAIFRETISVGGVYYLNMGRIEQKEGGGAAQTSPDQIMPSSQRLHDSKDPNCRTDLFAPGGPMTSTGILSNQGEAVQMGSAMAAPIVSGVILLMQDYHLRRTGRLPTVAELETWLRRGAVQIRDRPVERESVENAEYVYRRVDAYGALMAMHQALQLRELRSATVFDGSDGSTPARSESDDGTSPAPSAYPTSVAQALGSPDGIVLTVEGYIQGEYNDQFGLKLVDTLESATFLSVQLPTEHRASFSPRLKPNLRGLKVRITGKRARYNGQAGLREITSIRPVDPP